MKLTKERATYLLAYYRELKRNPKAVKDLEGIIDLDWHIKYYTDILNNEAKEELPNLVKGGNL